MDQPDVQGLLDSMKALEPTEGKAPVTETPAPSIPYRTLLQRVLSNQLKAEELPESVYKAFMRSILGGTAFMHTFSTMGGKLLVTFREPKDEEAKNYFHLRELLFPLKDVEIESRLAILVHLYEISTSDGKVIYKHTPLVDCSSEDKIYTEINKVYGDLCINIGGSLSRMIPQLWLIFSGIWSTLIDSEIPEDF